MHVLLNFDVFVFVPLLFNYKGVPNDHQTLFPITFSHFSQSKQLPSSVFDNLLTPKVFIPDNFHSEIFQIFYTV